MKRIPLRSVGGTCVQWAFSAAVVYVVWEWVLAPHVSQVFLAPPGPVWDQITSWASDGTLVNLVATTFSEALAGFLIGGAIGVAVALAIGLLPSLVGKLVEPFVIATYAMPKFVLVPILFVWLASGFTPRVILVAAAVFPVLAIYTLTGLRTIDPNQVTMLRLAGASRAQVGRKLLLPHTTRYVVTGSSFAFPHAAMMAIGAEILFGTSTGLGGTLYTDAQRFDATAVLAALVIATVLAAALTGACRFLGNLLLASSGLSPVLRN